jgi:hypothetical protein
MTKVKGLALDKVAMKEEDFKKTRDECNSLPV